MKINFSLSEKESLLHACKKRLSLLSALRVIVFLGLLATLVVGISDQSMVLVLFFPLAALFIYLIKQHNGEKDKEQFLLALIQMDAEATLRANRELHTFDPGNEYLEKDHPFAADLDIFGAHSLFQLIDHTVSKGGKNLLAKWLKAETNLQTASYRHGAVAELSNFPDFLRTFEGIGRAFLSKEKSKAALFGWLKNPNYWRKLFWVPAIMGPLLGTTLLFGILFGYLHYSYLSLFILVGILALGLVFKPLMQSMKVMPNESDLKTYKSWAYLLEDSSFSHPYLKSLRAPIADTHFQASSALESLEQQSFLVQNRANLMYLVFNLLFWVDFWVLYRLEKWKNTYGHHVQQWEEVFREWEALVSLSAFTVAEGTVAKIQWTESEVLEVENIRHPLIRPQDCVGNDFSLTGEQRIILLTGSNMSGKTTFMRTLGINMVMANAGLNPLAEVFICGPFQLYTSMRNSDNLGESVSSFYAELRRIKGLLQLTTKEQPVFFLLDEILKGTNTDDRVTGSRALIVQLLNTSSKGLISTHDMELTQLEGELRGIQNRSFHHTIEQEEIRFDYKIKPGSCPSFNAHKLMELMGITFEQ
ncbi:MAG: DNA mismatch repair protein [Lunatimonas sp.]|uniref:MutS-related protein n=1 Tax=Lunatimonas sp. TaxID=2060141 RepID=UPI00263BD5B2|nr:DNA mismatch repair protein [Lunatimonas sp.]MCC5936134.1 DNA mismatch repair protein [Lunatimonas sp.]